MAVALNTDYTLIVTDNSDILVIPKISEKPWKLPSPFLMDKNEMFDGEHVTMVAAKFENCACVTQEGSVWAWGCGFHEKNVRGSPPALISSLSPAKSSRFTTIFSSPAVMVTCYIDGIVFLTADGCVRQRSLYDIFSRAEKIILPTINTYISSCFDSIRIDMIASGKGHVMALGMSLPLSCAHICLCYANVFTILCLYRWRKAMDMGCCKRV